MSATFDIAEFLELIGGTVTYLHGYLPTITTGEETATTYHVHNGETVLEFSDRDTAEYVVQHYVDIYENMIEYYAYHAFGAHGRWSNRRTRAALHRSYGTRHLSLHQIDTTDLASLREAAEASQSNLRAMQDYGIQKHIEDIPTYTVESVDFQHSEVGHVARTRKIFTSRDTLQEHCARLLHDLQKFDKSFQEVFGYDTLEEAKQHERYLSRLLQTHSILDIYLLHYQHFPRMTSRDVIYDKFFNRFPNLRGDTKDLLYYQTLQDIQDDYGQSLQRRIMRTIFDRPELLDHINEAPFEWLVSTIDPAELDAENIPIQEKLTFP